MLKSWRVSDRKQISCQIWLPESHGHNQLTRGCYCYQIRVDLTVHVGIYIIKKKRGRLLSLELLQENDILAFERKKENDILTKRRWKKNMDLMEYILNKIV